VCRIQHCGQAIRDRKTVTIKQYLKVRALLSSA
jgi:hypothetical protein